MEKIIINGGNNRLVGTVKIEGAKNAVLPLPVSYTHLAHVEGIRRRGVKEYLKAFVTPGFMTPMNILEELTNFASLALRIFGNIFAGEVLASLLVTCLLYTSRCV